MKKILSTLMVSTVATVAATGFSPANAGTCSFNDVSYAPFSAADDCLDYTASSNLTPSEAQDYINNNNFGGYSDWLFDYKIDTGSGTTVGPNLLAFALSSTAEDQQSGRWGFTNSYTGPIVLELKGGNPSKNGGLAYYFFDSISEANPLAGSWNNNGIGGKGLSHASIFYTESLPPGEVVLPVPEPVTILGSAFALGFGGLLRKKYNTYQK